MYEIIKIFRICFILALTLTVAPLLSCYGADKAWPFTLDGGRLIVKSTPGELAESKAILERVDEKHIPGEMSGGVLFEGKVAARIADDKFGQPVWLMNPTHFFLGKDQVPADGLVVVSPKIENGGVMLIAGVKYRIFTVQLEGRFYIWKAVVIKLEK